MCLVKVEATLSTFIDLLAFALVYVPPILLILIPIYLDYKEWKNG